MKAIYEFKKKERAKDMFNHLLMIYKTHHCSVSKLTGKGFPFCFKFVWGGASTREQLPQQLPQQQLLGQEQEHTRLYDFLLNPVMINMPWISLLWKIIIKCKLWGRVFIIFPREGIRFFKYDYARFFLHTPPELEFRAI